MRNRTLVRDPALKEILQSAFRTEQLFKTGTNENKKNGHLVYMVCEMYKTDRERFIAELPDLVEHVQTLLLEQSVKRPGYLKASIGFKTDKVKEETKVEFSEPKPRKKKVEVPVKIVGFGKRGKQNKKPLF